MSQKSWYVLRIVVSLYLAYLGIKLILDVMKGRPENMVFMLVMAVVFIGVGVLYGIFSIKKVWALKEEESADAQEEKEVIEEDVPEENNRLENAKDKDTEQDEPEDEGELNEDEKEE